MNYAKARQIDPKADRPDAGKWRWTVENDGRVRPDGYCSPLEGCPECKGFSGIIRPDVNCERCGNRGLIERLDPCPGHDTSEEAAEHFRQYQIDRAEFTVTPDAEASELHRCEAPECDKFTASSMRIVGDGYYHRTVCPEHHTRETAEALIERHLELIYS